MSSEPVLRCRDLRKTFNVYRRPVDRVAELLSFGMRKYHRKFDALNGIGFDLSAGETVAVMGVNGSGKSTLLQILAGTMTPTEGRIEIRGRVAALLELGAGFIGEVTARENAVLAARLYGMTEEQAIERLPWIAEFSELQDHLNTPVKFFSSGMYARLAFAVATAVKPDVILIDEALSVGDIGFQRKAEAFLRDQLSHAAKIIVSHDHESIARHCSRAILLDRGTVAFDGPVREGIARMAGTSSPAPATRSLTRRVKGAMDVVVSDVRLVVAGTDDEADEGLVSPKAPVEVHVELESRAILPVPCILGHFWTEDSGREIFGASTETMGLKPVLVPRGRSRHVMRFAFPDCRAGTYRLNVAAVSIDTDGTRTVQCRVEDVAALTNTKSQTWGTSFFVDGDLASQDLVEERPSRLRSILAGAAAGA